MTANPIFHLAQSTLNELSLYEKVEQGDLRVCYVSPLKQRVDIFTEALGTLGLGYPQEKFNVYSCP